MTISGDDAAQKALSRLVGALEPVMPSGKLRAFLDRLRSDFLPSSTKEESNDTAFIDAFFDRLVERLLMWEYDRAKLFAAVMAFSADDRRLIGTQARRSSFPDLVTRLMPPPYAIAVYAGYHLPRNNSNRSAPLLDDLMVNWGREIMGAPEVMNAMATHFVALVRRGDYCRSNCILRAAVDLLPRPSGDENNNNNPLGLDASIRRHLFDLVSSRRRHRNREEEIAKRRMYGEDWNDAAASAERQDEEDEAEILVHLARMAM